MSIAYRTGVLADYATPALAEKLAQCRPQRLRNIVGPALARYVQTHLLGNGPNKRGWPTTRFWPRAARSTSWWSNAASSNVIISINQIGVRQRYYGGIIRPVKAKALAIPISPVSYGHVPADFADLFLVKTKKGAFLCQRGLELSASGRTVARKKLGGNNRRRRPAELHFLFKLSARVTQPGDKSIVPTGDELLAVAMARVEEAVK